MADQIATRFGLLDRDLSHAALQTIVLTAADAIDALDEAHQRLCRTGVPDAHPAHLAPRQRWEQLLRNLFPASIMVVDPHGNASPGLATLPTGSDEAERSVRRLLTAAAAFLLAETTTLEDTAAATDAGADGYDWADSHPAGADEDLDTVDELLIPASRAARTLLDHAESGQWRYLLATFVPAPEPATPPAEQSASLVESHHLPVLVWSPTGSGKTSTYLGLLSLRLLCSHPRVNYWSTLLDSWWAEPDVHVDFAAHHSANRLSPTDRWGALWGAEHLDGRWLTAPAQVPGSLRLSALARLLERERGKLCASRLAVRHAALRPEHLLHRPPPHALWMLDYTTGLSTTGPLRFPSSVVEETGQDYEMSRQLLLAARQLDSPDIDVKLAGLAGLEAFAQANPDLRQTVVNVWCGYLRGPAPDIGHDIRHDDDAWRFRVAVHTTLAAHLRPGPNPTHPQDNFWPRLDLDLDNAVVLDLDLTGCQVRSARFTGTRFHGNTVFTDMRIGCTLFDGARFAGDVVFTRATFTDEVRFLHTRFRGDAVFTNVQFDRDCRFDAARFDEDAVFTRSVFLEDARFIDTEFNGDAVFDDATFSGLARFGHARFLAGVRFDQTRFHRDHDDTRTWDLDGALLAQAPGWVRTDTATAAEPRRVWPAGWSVQPTRDQPRGEDEGHWGRLVPDPLPAAS